MQNWGWNAFAQRVQHALRIDTYDAMQSLEMGFFDDRQTGQLLSVLSNDEAIRIAASAVQAAVERDAGSGNGVYLAEITDTGVDIHGHTDFSEVL